MPVFGKPGDRQAQINRSLRRGMPGVMSGRSEASAPVVLRRRRGIEQSGGGGLPGPGGAPGLPIVDPFKRGRHLIGSVGLGAGLTFGFSATTARGTRTTQTLDGDPFTVHSSSAAASDYGALLFANPAVQVGQGNGRGGFVYAAQIAFSALSGTGWWFAGVTANEVQNFGPDTLPTTAINLVGVGQDVADSTPYFIHNDATGTTTRVSTGLADMAAGSVHEVRIYANPLGTSFAVMLSRFADRVLVESATYTATANVPTVLLGFQVVAGNGTGGGVVGAGFKTLYLAVQPTQDIGLDA